MNDDEFNNWNDQDHDMMANMELPDEYTFVAREEHVDSLHKVLRNALELAMIDYQRKIFAHTDAKFIAYNEFLQEMTRGLLSQLDDASVEGRYRWMKLVGEIE
jgi:hypothetical protein